MAHEKRLLIDVFQAYFYRKDETTGDRKLIFMSENLTSGSISSSQENTDVRNGQGNTLFAILPGNKDVTVNLTENVFSFEALELNTAGERVAGAATGNSGLIAKRAGKLGADLEVNVQVGAQNNMTRYKLPKVPQRVGDVVISVGGAELTYVNSVAGVDDETKFTLVVENGNIYDGTNANVDADAAVYVVLTLQNGNDLRTTKDLKILPYIYKTKTTTTSTLTVDAKKFAEGGELWLQTIEKDEKQKASAYVYFVFDNVMPEGNFEISTVSEVQPNDMTINMRVLANEDGELYRIVREEIV